MILVIGGLASGKRSYVKNTYSYADCDMADAVLNDRPVVYNVQELVRLHPDDTDALFSSLIEKNIVIVNEVGAGLIPMDAFERKVRELTGRLTIRLAEKAERVVRLSCGIPMMIKG